MAEDSTRTDFGDRLITAVRTVGHPLCVGLDPHIGKIPPVFSRRPLAASDPAAPRIVRDFLCTVCDRLEGRVAIVKPQFAFFERMGWRGMEALQAVVGHARRRGLLVLLDAKRGDIGSTSAAYAEAYLGPDAPMRGDALTVNPYLGPDTLTPFAASAAATGAGLFVLVRTSNPGAGKYQEVPVRSLDHAEAETVSELVAASLGSLVREFRGERTGWSSIGIVVGATSPEQAERLRALLPSAPFLVPGYGAQGAGADDAVRCFVDGPAGPEGGIVNASRSVLFAEACRTDDRRTWEAGFDAAVDQAAEELAAALARRGR